MFKAALGLGVALAVGALTLRKAAAASLSESDVFADGTTASKVVPQYRVGLDIGGTKFAMVALNADDDIVVTHRVPTGEDIDVPRVERALEEFKAKLEAFNGTDIDYSRVSAGLSFPGLLDPTTKTVVMAPDVPKLIGWTPPNSPLLRDIADVFCANDIEAAMEEAIHQSPGVKNMAVLVLGSGLGAAYLVDGKLLTGKSGFAGEFGLAHLDLEGTTLDSKVGGKSMLRALGMDHLDTETFVSRVAAKDPEAVGALDSCAKYFGLSIAQTIQIFNPERVFVGGGMLAWPGFFDTAVDTVKAITIPEMYADCDIVLSTNERMLPVVGAARGGERVWREAH